MPAKKSSKSRETSSAVKTSPKVSAKSQVPGRKRATSAPSRKALTPDANQVAEAAYLNYCHRIEKGLPENPHEDWLKAERELGLRK